MSTVSNTLTGTQLRSRRFGGPAGARARAFLILLWEAFGEGREMSRAAHKRYPFAEW